MLVGEELVEGIARDTRRGHDLRDRRGLVAVLGDDLEHGPGDPGPLRGADLGGFQLVPAAGQRLTLPGHTRAAGRHVRTLSCCLRRAYDRAGQGGSGDSGTTAVPALRSRGTMEDRASAARVAAGSSSSARSARARARRASGTAGAAEPNSARRPEGSPQARNGGSYRSSSWTWSASPHGRKASIPRTSERCSRRITRCCASRLSPLAGSWRSSSAMP